MTDPDTRAELILPEPWVKGHSTLLHVQISQAKEAEQAARERELLAELLTARDAFASREAAAAVAEGRREGEAEAAAALQEQLEAWEVRGAQTKGKEYEGGGACAHPEALLTHGLLFSTCVMSMTIMHAGGGE